jgi:hypothetical protein
MPRRLPAVAPFVALALACVASLACLSCDSPTLPLPPPMAPTVTAGSDANHFKLTSACGGVEGGVTVIIENIDTTLADDQRVTGTLASPCGSWDAIVYGNRGDVLNITQDDGSVVSSPEVFQLPQ